MFRNRKNDSKKTKKDVFSSFIAKGWFWFKSLSFIKHIFMFYFILTFVGTMLLFSESAQVSPSHGGKYISFIDALFTSASAFSDTGLSSVTTATTFNYFGQAIIAMLILIGGLGWFALKVYFFNILLGRPVSFVSRDALSAERGISNLGSVRDLIKIAVTTLFTVILLAGITLSVYFYCVPPSSADQNTTLHDYTLNSNERIHVSNFGGDDGTGKGFNSILDSKYIPYHNWDTSIRYGLFHSISAINNAGFDIIGSNSISGYYSSYGLQIIFIILFVLGGVGYPVIYDCWMKFKGFFTGKKHNWSLFSKISMSAYLIITLIGLAITFSIELTTKDDIRVNSNWVDASGAHPGVEKYPSFWNDPGYGTKGKKVMALFFNTMSTRNAGFSTINISSLSQGTQVVYTLLMFVGSAPSSTNGGIRTTTMAVVVLGLWSRIRGKNKVRAFNRRIPTETVKNSYIVFTTSLILIFLASLIVMTSLQTHGGDLNAITEKIDPTTGKQLVINGIPQFTENINKVTGSRYNYTRSSLWSWFCFGITGLSTGITSSLSLASKIALVFVMFIGQLGVSSSILVWQRKNPKSKHYEYVKEDISIG